MKFNNKNVTISPKAQLGKNVKLGDNTIIYDNVVIGDNTIIVNDCVIGEPLNDYYYNENYVQPKTIIGADSLVRSHTIIYAGVETGIGLNTGHRVTVRERAIIGDHCSIGTLSDIQGDCRLGNYTRLHSNVHVAQRTQIGNYVFVFPFTVFTNDPLPPSSTLNGAVIEDYAIITVHNTILPGVRVGKHAVVGASSVVSRDIDAFTFALGAPAKKIKDVREIRSKEHKDKFHYPWPYSFERGMPWAEVGYDEWLKTQSDD